MDCELCEESVGEVSCQIVDVEDQVLDDLCFDIECELWIESVLNIL